MFYCREAYLQPENGGRTYVRVPLSTSFGLVGKGYAPRSPDSQGTKFLNIRYQCSYMTLKRPYNYFDYMKRTRYYFTSLINHVAYILNYTS